MRRKLLLGNWKMNKTVTEAKEFALQAKELGKLAKANKIDMGICVPAIDLEPVKKILKKYPNIKVHIQEFSNNRNI